MQGAHGGMHEMWHVAYEEAPHAPFTVSSPLLPGGARELVIPTTHGDLIPTQLGLTGIDADRALARLQPDQSDAHPLVGRDRSQAIRAPEPTAPTEPLLFTTDDEISEGNERSASPFIGSPRAWDRLSTVKAAQRPAERDRRGRRRRRAAPGQVLPLLRHEPVLDASRESATSACGPPHRGRHRTRPGRVRALRPDARSQRGTQPATPTMAPGRSSRRSLDSSSSNSPPNDSYRQLETGPATGRPRV
jgi:hypothetical protein